MVFYGVLVLDTKDTECNTTDLERIVNQNESTTMGIDTGVQYVYVYV